VAEGIGLLNQHTSFCIMGSNPISSEMPGAGMRGFEIGCARGTVSSQRVGMGVLFKGRTHALQA
jgi:hypothetical protein